MYLYILIVSVVLYIILQFLDDRRNIALHKAPNSTSSKVVLMFLSFILTTVAFYLFWDSAEAVEVIKLGGGGDENITNHLDYIDQEIDTGFPDF